MASIVDERGYNQGFKETKALIVRTDRRVDAIVHEFNKNDQNAKVLELGCGTGLLSRMVSDKSGLHVTGIDLSQSFVDEANQRYANDKVHYLRVNLNQAQLELEKFDYIIGNGILHHLYHDLEPFMSRLKMFLKPNGKIIFWEPNLYNPYVFLIFKIPPLRRLAKLEPDEMAFTPKSIRSILDRQQYKDISVSCRDFLLPNTPRFLINITIKIGAMLELNRFSARLAQSLFITASH